MRYKITERGIGSNTEHFHYVNNQEELESFMFKTNRYDTYYNGQFIHWK